MQISRVMVGPSGWAQFDTDPVALVRFKEADDGRLEPVGIMLKGAVLSNRILQTLPFGRMEALINVPEFADPLRERIRVSIFDPEAGPFEVFEVADDLVAGGYSALDLINELEALGETAPGWSGRHSDRFYQIIATLYQWQAGRSEKPGALLARALDVPIANVWRWVRVCRERGHLPPARVGKEG